jgi:hypothetical protein
MIAMHNDLKKENFEFKFAFKKGVGIFIQLIIGPMNFSKQN